MNKLKPKHRIPYYIGYGIGFVIGLLMRIWYAVPKRVTNWRMENENRRNDVA